MELFENIVSEIAQLKAELSDKETLSKRIRELQSENEGKPMSFSEVSKTCKKFRDLPDYLSKSEFGNVAGIYNIRKKAMELSSLVSQKMSKGEYLRIEILSKAEMLLKLVSDGETAEVWGIYDAQRREFRDEEYSSKEEAIREFSEYWKGIVFSDVCDTFDFEDYKSQHNISHELSKKEENEIVQKYLDDWDNKEFLDWYEMEVRKLELF